MIQVLFLAVIEVFFIYIYILHITYIKEVVWFNGGFLTELLGLSKKCKKGRYANRIYKVTVVGVM